MSNRLAALCGLVLAATLVAPASAQIIVGGKAVTAKPADPTEPVTLALGFPADPDAAGYAPISVATPVFSGDSPAEAELAAKISDVVRADLASVGIFTAPDTASISAFSANISALPVWTEWSGASVGALLVGKAIIGPDNSLTVQFRLYDVAERKQIIGSQYKLASADAWRRAAHKVADGAMVALVGGKGGFDSLIAHLSEAGGARQLAVIGADGSGREVVLGDATGLDTPRLSPAGLGLVYTADAAIPGKPNQSQRTANLYDLGSGQRQALTAKPGMSSDTRYSADAASLIYSRKQGANTDIYMMALSSGAETRLTDDTAADTQPTLSPDGARFAFVSERAGGKALYVARVDGAPVRCADGSEAKACRLTTGPGTAEGPVWSPSGDWIAYARVVGEDAAIHIVRPDGSGARALTTPGRNVLDLHPTWSPEGRRLAFYRVAGSGSAVHVVALAGGEPRKLDIPGDSFEPDWGPKLP